MKRREVHVGLVHWPVLDRSGEIVATNITHFDVHDIARVCRSYGVKNYFLINRQREQLMYVARVLEHWQVGSGVKMNPMRQTALNEVRTAETVESVLKEIPGEVEVVATAARFLKSPPQISFQDLRARVFSDDPRAVLLLFGTGFGLAGPVLKQSHWLLEPIQGGAEDNYRHLSVRSAASICLDRLLSK